MWYHVLEVSDFFVLDGDLGPFPLYRRCGFFLVFLERTKRVQNDFHFLFFSVKVFWVFFFFFFFCLQFTFFFS